MKEYRKVGRMSKVIERVEIANQIEGNQAVIAEIIREDVFVDDLLTGADSIEEAEYICKNVSNVLKSAGFELQKWYSNEPGGVLKNGSTTNQDY
ncbi:hypothetical protein ILUMI_04036 [Ignelater luminosus]|uniref:Uncharacterized protein n=1 Tax=Ignelater luminosus TaxID=2038154 RepID=A0A8K0DF40_IGNLU|nr:hypothetical protein ILUMI_04036 [Ignelater luminosus]